MTESTPTNHQQYTLTATYRSPTTSAPFTHAHTLPTPPTTSPKDRVAYLHALREATVDLQERINKELTERMEEDKVRESAGKEQGTGGGVDEKKEEENYGEEVVEED